MSSFNKNKKGFSLLELMLVVMAGSVFAIGTLAIYRSMNIKTQVDNAIELIDGIKTGIIRTSIGTSSYAQGSLLEGRIVRMGAIKQQNVAGDQIVTLFSTGDESVVIDSDGSSFDITLNDVPLDMCIRLFSAYNINSAGYEGFLYNNNSISNPTPDIANDRCSENPSQNTLTWRFR